MVDSRKADMYVKMLISECDFTDKKYPSRVMGAGAVARGATGRHCVVMTMGPEYIKQHGIELTSYDDAVAKIDAMGGNNWADF